MLLNHGREKRADNGLSAIKRRRNLQAGNIGENTLPRNLRKKSCLPREVYNM